MKLIITFIFVLVTGLSEADTGAPSTEVRVGSNTPTVILYEYGSLTCHVCAKFVSQVKDELLKEYGDKLQVVMRPFPFNKIDIEGFKGIFCSNDPSEAADLIYSEQDEWISETDQIKAVMKLLKNAVTNSKEFETCLNNQQLEQQIIMRRKFIKANAAPILKIGKVKVVGLPKTTTLKDWIKEAIQFVESGNKLTEFVGTPELRKSLGLKPAK